MKRIGSFLGLAGIVLAACSGSASEGTEVVRPTATTPASSGSSTTAVGSCEEAANLPIVAPGPAPYFVYGPAEECLVGQADPGSAIGSVRPVLTDALDAESALGALFRGPAESDLAEGFSSVFGSRPMLMASAERAGSTLRLDVTDEFFEVPNIATSQVSAVALAQLKWTIFSDSTLREAVVSVGGSIEDFCSAFLGESGICRLTRDEFLQEVDRFLPLG